MKWLRRIRAVRLCWRLMHEHPYWTDREVQDEITRIMGRSDW